ncbi:MAG: hypothetical protein JNL38_33625 [Myxococcales bacterium]|nr:hypothetical protein [Myxococcales bacterium]
MAAKKKPAAKKKVSKPTAPKKKPTAPKKKAPAPKKKAAPAAKKKAAPAKKKKAAAPAKKAAGPWRRMKYDDGGFGLFFGVDAFFEMGSMEIFEKGGGYANGPGWESVIAPAFEKAFPKLADAIEYDCEGDMFVARAEDDAHLDALAGVIAAITASPAALAAAVAARDPDRD